MATVLPKPALRPMLPADAPMLAAIFRASIEDLTVEDYDEDQRAAWAASADDEAAFGEARAAELTLVATIDGAAVGFGSLKGGDHIEMLFVYPTVAGQGIGSMVADALEKLAHARGASKLTVDASDTARSFFEKRGYRAQRRNTVSLNGEWLANTTLERRFEAATP